MAKKKEKVADVKPVEVNEPAPVVVEEVKKEEVKSVPSPVATGKFYVENRPGGAVVIGKLGQVVSNPMPLNKANKLADHMNNAR